MTRLRRQVAIASAGRAASTSVYHSIVGTLRSVGSVEAIWEHASGERLAETYRKDAVDFIVTKAETFHFVDRLEHGDRTTLILLKRRNHLRQLVSHLVSLRTGRFHSARGGEAARPFRIERHEFLALAHMILMMEQFQDSRDFSRFDQVERWWFEELTTDFAGHMARIGLAQYVDQQLLGVRYDRAVVENLDEVVAWANGLAGDGFRTGEL